MILWNVVTEESDHDAIQWLVIAKTRGKARAIVGGWYEDFIEPMSIRKTLERLIMDGKLPYFLIILFGKKHSLKGT